MNTKNVLGDTGKFKVHDIVGISKGGFVLARGYWEGGKDLCLACRWHEDDEIGYPQTFGKPQWMLLPRDDTLVEVTTGLDSAVKVRITMTGLRELAQFWQDRN